MFKSTILMCNLMKGVALIVLSPLIGIVVGVLAIVCGGYIIYSVIEEKINVYRTNLRQ